MRRNLEEITRLGAQQLLTIAMEAEVDDFLQRVRYARGKEFRGSRNGHAVERGIGIGMGRVQIRMPRVNNVPPEIAATGFESKIVGRYQRISESTQRFLAQLVRGVEPRRGSRHIKALLLRNAPAHIHTRVRLDFASLVC